MPTKPTSLAAAAAPFLPEIVRALLDTNPQPMVPPWSLRFEGAVIRVLIEGFPALVETFVERPQDGVRLMSQATDSFYGERVGIIHAFGGSTVLIDGLGMVLLFPTDVSPEAKFLAGRAALGAGLLLRGTAGPGRGRLGARGPSIELRLGCHMGEITLGAVGSKLWQVVLTGPGLAGADTAALNAQSGELMATDDLLSWVGTVRTEGTFHRGMASVIALPPPEDRLEPTSAGLRGANDELQRRILEAVPAVVRDWANAGAGPWPSRFESTTIVHVGLEGLGSGADPKALEKLHIVVERATKVLDEAGGHIESAEVGESHGWLSLSFSAEIGDRGRLRAALHACLELRRALRVPFLKGLRVGVVSGTVFRTALGGSVRRQPAIFGPPLEAALRLAALATPGQILVDAADRETAENLFEFETQTIRLTATGQKARDMAKRVQSREVHILLRSLDPLYRSAVEKPFVGRQLEIALCENALLEAKTGKGAAFLVTGPRGQGKTSLLQAAAAKAQEMEIPSLRVDCRPASGPLDLHPLELLLSKLAPAASEPAAPPAPEPQPASDPARPELAADTEKPDAPRTEPRELARNLANALRDASERSPLLIQMDDLHKASPLARNLSRKMGAMLSSLPVVFLLAEEPPPADAPAPAGSDLLELLPIPPLPEEELAELTTYLREGKPLAPEFQPALNSLSQGNPLHLAELLAALDLLPADQQTPEALTTLPADLPGLVAWRLNQLEPELRTLLEQAASLDLPMPLEDFRASFPDPQLVSDQMARLGTRGFPLPLSGTTPVQVDFAESLHREMIQLLASGPRLLASGPEPAPPTVDSPEANLPQPSSLEADSLHSQAPGSPDPDTAPGSPTD